MNWSFLLLFLLVQISLSAQSGSNFQVNAGAAINYPVRLHTTGFSAKMGFDFYEKIRVLPSFTKYLNTFPNAGGGVPTSSSAIVSAWEAEFYTQYLVETTEQTLVYFSGGYGYYKSEIKSNSDSKPYEEIHKVKVGIGFQFWINRWKFLGDFHFVPGKNYDFIPSVGFLYTVKK